MSSSVNYRIRPASPSDAPVLLELIQGLAEYERAPEEVTNTVEQLIEDGWGKTPRFQAFIADVLLPSTSGIYVGVGMALTFFAYSTWKGPCLYLEDIYVKPEYRNHGLGLALIKHCVYYATDHHCHRVMWSALDWNNSAIDFYTQKIGAIQMKEWINIRLTKEGMHEFSQRYPRQVDSNNTNTHTDTDATIEPSEVSNQQMSIIR